MQKREAGETLREHARFTGRIGMTFAVLGLILALIFLLLAFDNLLKVFGTRATPANGTALLVGLLTFVVLIWGVKQLFHQHDRAS